MCVWGSSQSTGVVNTVLKGFTAQDCLHKWYLHMSRSWEFSRFPQAWRRMTSSVFGQTYKKIIKGFKVNAFAFEELCFSPSGPPPSLVPLPHFLTLVFSSSPFSRLPRSPEFAAGQKAAAEAQPIWNAAPPFWRSEGGRRHEIGCKKKKQDAKNPQVVYAQPTRAAGRVSSRWKRSGTSNAEDPAVNQWLDKAPVVHLKWRDYSPEWNETLRVLHIKRLLFKWWQKQHDALLSPWLQIVMSQENNSW